MKELSIEQKAEAYNKVREKIALRFGSNVAEEIFSEFEMSEDEKIRKELMDFIDTKTIDSDERRNRWFSYLKKYKPISFTSLEDTKVKMSLMQYISELNQDVVHLHPGIETCNEWIAWLEKQGEKKSVNWNELTWEDINDLEAIMNEVHSDFRNGIGQKSFGLEVLERFLYNKDCEDLDVKSPKFKDGDEIRSIDGQYEDTVLEVLSDGSYRLKNLGLLSIPENEWELVNAPVNGYELIDKKEQNTQKVLGQQLEKQGEHKGINDTDEDIAEAVKDTSILDMVEPMFKVGDWVVDNCGYTWKIEGILNQFYLLEGIEGGESRPTIEWVNKTFHLWNISDAKDGDVLVCNDYPFLFSKYEIDEYGPVCCSYCGISNSDYGEFLINTNTKKYWCDIEFVNPATKEQRELLFQKMKEAGYMRDADKKKVVKCVIDEGKAEMDYCFTKMMNGEQVSSAWSEEDEQHIDSLLRRLDGLCRNEFERTRFAISEDEDWLKSLRPQPKWKPSEEQINALDEVYKTHGANSACRRVLITLLNDLKNLTE